MLISGREPIRSERIPAIGATSIGMPVQGSVRRPASSGEYIWTVWKNCASRKIAPKMPNVIARETPLVAANARLRKKRIGSIGAAVRSSCATNATSRAAPTAIEPATSSEPQPARVAADDAVDDAEEAGAGERDAREVEPPRRAVALLQLAHGERGEDEADGHVEPEDPLPADALDDGAADERAERDAEAAHAGPDAEREAALLGGGVGAQQRERERGDDRGADALERAGGDQRAGRGREGGGGRGGGEDPQADHEDAAAAEAVAERRAGEEEDGERERVRVDRPLQRLDRSTEVLADARERVRDDEVVEGDHEDREALTAIVHGASFVGEDISAPW